MYQQIQRCSQIAVLLLVLCRHHVRTQNTETSTSSYETAHEMALTAFEVFLPLGSSSHSSNPQFTVANEMMDMALEKVRGVITRENLDRVKIPDFSEPFRKKIGFFHVGGKFYGKDGWVESLLSIERRGNAVVHVDGTSLALDVPLGLKTLQLGMKFQVEFLGIKPKQGEITGRVRSNNVVASAEMNYASGECKLRVRSVNVTDLGKIDVDVTGYGDLNWLASQIASWVTDKAHARIREAVENVLFKFMQTEMDKYPCPAL